MAAEIPDGAVLIARAILNSSLWTMRNEDRILAITLISLANWRDRKWFDGEKDMVIRRGQLVRSLEQLAEAAQISLRNVRTSLKRLEKCGFLTRETTRRYTHVTLCKYDHYQKMDNYSDIASATQVTRDRQNHDTTVTRDRHEPDNKQEGEERKESKEEEKSAACAALPPPGEFLDTLTGALGIRAEDPTEETVAPPTENMRRLIDLAKKTTKMPGKRYTIREYLEAAILRVGAQKLEEWLMNPMNGGKDVFALQDELKPDYLQMARDKFLRGEEFDAKK